MQTTDRSMRGIEIAAVVMEDGIIGFTAAPPYDPSKRGSGFVARLESAIVSC